MKISQGLQVLIDASLIDGKISSKEKQILLKKAESEGIDKDEFELYISLLIDEKQKKDDIAYSINPLTGEKIKYSKSQTKKSLFISLSLLIVLGLFIFYMASKEHSEVVRPSDKYGCTSFEECISKYQFDGAYYYYSLDPSKEKEKELVSSQVAYWSREKDFDKAFDVLMEYKIEANYNLGTGDDEDEKNTAYNEKANFYNNQLDDIINKMMIVGVKKDTILKFCKAFKPIVIGNENDKSFLGFGDYKSSVLSNEPYKNMLVKVNEMKQ